MCDHGVAGLTPPPAPVSRRGFLFKLGLAVNAVAAVLVGVPLVGYVASAVRRRGQQAWISLGPVANFPERQTRLASYTNPFSVPWDGKVADIPCWVRRLEGDRFQIFAINCTHLGCPIRWFQASGLFMCPCHGGVFYEDGRHASGPPPRPLYQYEHRIKDGELWVRGGQIPTLSEPV